MTTDAREATTTAMSEEMLALVVSMGADVRRARDNWMTALTRARDEATDALTKLDAGRIPSYGLAPQTATDSLTYEREYRTAIDALAHLLVALDARDDLDAVVSDPWSFYRTHTTEA